MCVITMIHDHWAGRKCTQHLILHEIFYTSPLMDSRETMVAC